MENIFGNPELEKRGVVRWKMSGAWARKPINCTMQGIINECHGCCTVKPGWNASKMYPIRAFGPGATQCGFFVPGSGCSFSLKERPMNCMFYPFVLNSSGTFVISGHALTSSCKHAYRTQATSIFVHFKDTWIAIFGEEQYNRVHQDIIVDMKDESYFYPSERIIRIMEVENERERNSEKPTDRNEIV